MSKWWLAMKQGLVGSARKDLTIFNPSDLKPRSLNDLDLLNSKGLRQNAFSHHKVQQRQKNNLFQLFPFKSLRVKI